MIVFDLETINTKKAVRYGHCIFRLNKNSGKYNRHIRERVYENCRKDGIVFKGTDSKN